MAIVNRISVGENFPVTTRASPSNQSQIRLMMKSQNTKRGTAAEDAQAERRTPRAKATPTGRT
jgi:hypothetical protein